MSEKHSTILTTMLSIFTLLGNRSPMGDLILTVIIQQILSKHIPNTWLHMWVCESELDSVPAFKELCGDMKTYIDGHRTDTPGKEKLQECY